MRKDVLLFSSYIDTNYYVLQKALSKRYVFDMDIYHDCIIDIYTHLSMGNKFVEDNVIRDIAERYRKYRNKEISNSHKEKSKEDKIIEFIDNKTDVKIEYNNSIRSIKEKASLLLSKKDFLILDLYFFQNKPKRIVSLFTGSTVPEIDRRIEYIKSKLLKNISYENHSAE